ncbi:hypothetical protein FRC12_004922 [Ceratobasidium sp. 428]|nr:hypothetical protein FRC12_004922 [Ceratobasidium sp. 428]
MLGWRDKVGLKNHQLDEVMAHSTEDRASLQFFDSGVTGADYWRITTAANYMLQYFIKVVSAEFNYLGGEVAPSN